MPLDEFIYKIFPHRLKILSSVPKDAKVTIKVEKADGTGPFNLVKGQVFYQDLLAAHGQIKFFNDAPVKG